MAGYQRPEGGWRFHFQGLKTNAPADAINPTKSPYVQNVRSTLDQTVQTRPGYQPVFVTTDVIVATCPEEEVTINVPYSGTISVIGGTAPYTFELVAGALPTGLTLDESTGEISGTPTEAGDFSYTVHITDSSEPPLETEITCTIRVNVDSLVLACPAVQPVIDVAYEGVLVASGGVEPYTFAIILGVLPTGLTLDEDTGIISGTPTESGDFDYTAQVTDSQTPTPDTATAECTMSVSNEEPVIDMAYYIESSPRQDPTGLTTRYLYILPPSRDKLFRSIGPYTGSDPHDWGVWEEEAVPEGFAPRRIYGCNQGDSAIGFADEDDPRMMSKALCQVSTDPFPQTDNPWVEYPLNVPAKATSGNPIVVPDPFWTPDTGGRAPLGYIGTDEVIHQQRSEPPGDPVTCTYFNIIDAGINTLPTGTWHHMLSRQNSAGDEYLGVLVVGEGDKIAKWEDGDTEWTLVDCPDGNLQCSAVAYSANTLVAVGLGDVPIVVSYDYGGSWITFPAVDGWTPVAPRVIFDPNLNVSDTSGTFVVTGGQVDGVDAVMLLPMLTADDTLDTAILAGIPSLPGTAILRAASVTVQTKGLLIIGFDTAFAVDDPDGIIILANPELTQSGSPATYDDFHLRTISQAPFVGLT